MYMKKTKIKWHDYSEINKYDYTSGHMLFRYEADGEIGYIIGGWSMPSWSGRTGLPTPAELYFEGGAVYKWKLIEFALFSEFEEE